MSDNFDDLNNAGVFLGTVRMVAGDTGVRLVEEARGGTKVTIPVQPDEGHWLSRSLGHGPAKEVCARLHVDDADGRPVPYPKFVIPLGFKAIVQQNLRKTDQLLQAGHSVSVTALLVGVHERTVWRRRARLVQEGKLNRATKPDMREANELLMTGHSVRETALLVNAPERTIELRRARLVREGKIPRRCGENAE